MPSCEEEPCSVLTNIESKLINVKSGPVTVTLVVMGVILFILASGIVGARLLLLYRRLKQPPELFLGLAYLLAGTLGWAVLLVGTLTTSPGQHVSEKYQAFSVVMGDLGTFCFYLFVWYVFRRDSAVAKALLALAALALVVSLAADTFVRGVTYGPPPGTVSTIAGSIARAFVFPWMAWEALGSYSAFRRRARVGLGNPLVQNRLLLWGLSALATFGISGTATALYWTASDVADAVVKQNRATGLYGALGAVSALLLWLAFFPPERYQRFIEGRKEAHDGRQ